GDSRVKPKSTANFSSEDIYVYNGLFATTTTDGDLFSVDSKGNASTESLNLNTQHHMDATSKTLAAITDNKLRIKSNTVELDFGIYSVPKIFYINDKIYVSVTDMQTNKVYLFDSLGKPLHNFPVYGNSAIDMDNADGDRNPEIIVKSGTDELLMYQVN
ncbi:MAG: ribonuclease HII, partial [Mangrovimonas sp.]|nr:ribonuclease HII [Mangrovimonas sp.]